MSSHLNVFINCPFDIEYREFFEAILFTVTASGYRPRCALEENSSADIRFDKLCQLVEDSDRSIHDLSRTELGENALPRFNMPFELGLMMGAKRFGGKRQRAKSALVMVNVKYTNAVYLSDLAGVDAQAHHGQSANVIKLVRNYLFKTPQGILLPGPARMTSLFQKFKSDLPKIATSSKIGEDECDPFDNYPDYSECLTTFLKTV